MGPTKGGTRFAPSVNMGEVAALSIWMSWKCALAGLPYGGAKGGITVSPRDLSIRELEAVSRRYMQEMIPFVGPHTDIMGPDMGTNEQVMAWFMDTYSVHVGHTVNEIVTGKPVFLGGSAGRRESTGRGVAFLVERALDTLKIEPGGCTAIVQGYGNVGSVAAEALFYKSGVKIVGLSDAYAAFYDPKGIDLNAIGEHMRNHPDLSRIQGRGDHRPGEMLVQPCDILIPAAVDRVINGSNAGQLQCRILAEAANGPTTPEADVILDQRQDEILVIPDILCNAGGVIVSYFEWVQDLQNFFWNETEIADKLVPHHGRGVLGGRQTGAKREDPQSPRGAGHRGRARAQGQADPGIISLTRGRKGLESDALGSAVRDSLSFCHPERSEGPRPRYRLGPGLTLDQKRGERLYSKRVPSLRSG